MTGRRVISYDRAGFGKSTARTEKISHDFIREETDVIAQLCAELQLDEFILFGHSVGGGMALTAASYLTGCTSVISEAAQSFMQVQTQTGIIAGQAKFSDPEQMQRLQRYHGEKAEWVLRSWGDGWLGPDFRNWSLRGILPEIHVPVLVIHGDRDEFATVAQAELITSMAAGPTQKEIFSSCGHVPHREYPEKFLSIVSAFLNLALRPQAE